MAQSSESQSNIDLPAVLFAVVVGFTAVLLVASIPVGVYTVFYGHLSNTGLSSGSVVAQVPIWIGIVPAALPISPTYGQLFAVLTALYVVLIVIAGYQGGGFIRALSETRRQGVRSMLRNPLSATIIILGTTLLLTVLLDYLQAAAGIPTGGISGDPLGLLVSFTLAPLIEEVGFRFFLIGVPLFLILLVTRSSLRRSLKSLWRPSAAWDPEETEDSRAASMKMFVVLLMILSSVVFGLAHYLSGAGWDIGKVSEAALDGFALAYLYVRYGLHASIIFHWTVDYASNSFAFYAQSAYGVSWTANSIFTTVPTVDIVFLVGVPGVAYFASLLFKRYAGNRLEVEAPPPPAAVQPGLASGGGEDETR